MGSLTYSSFLNFYLCSSNINEVIRSVLNFFFLWWEFTSTKKHKKNTRHQKVPKSTKKYKNKQPKAQNTNKWIKIKNGLKKHLSGKK